MTAWKRLTLAACLAAAGGCSNPNPQATAPDKPVIMPPKGGEGMAPGGTPEGRPKAPADTIRDNP